MCNFNWNSMGFFSGWHCQGVRQQHHEKEVPHRYDCVAFPKEGNGGQHVPQGRNDRRLGHVWTSITNKQNIWTKRFKICYSTLYSLYGSYTFLLHSIGISYNSYLSQTYWFWVRPVFNNASLLFTNNNTIYVTVNTSAIILFNPKK